MPMGYLLQENGERLLQENGKSILLSFFDLIISKAKSLLPSKNGNNVMTTTNAKSLLPSKNGNNVIL